MNRERLLSKSWNYEELKEDLLMLHNYSLSMNNNTNESIDFDSLFVDENNSIHSNEIMEKNVIERRPSIKVEAPDYDSDSDEKYIESNMIDFTSDQIKVDLDNSSKEVDNSNIVNIWLSGRMSDNEDFKDELNKSIDNSWRAFDHAIQNAQKQASNENIDITIKLLNENEPIEKMLDDYNQHCNKELENSINDLNKLLQQTVINQDENLKQHIIKEKQMEERAKQIALEAARKKAEAKRLEMKRLEDQRKKQEEEKKKEAARVQMAKLAAEKKIEDEKKKAQISPSKNKNKSKVNSSSDLPSTTSSSTKIVQLQTIIKQRLQKFKDLKEKASHIKENEQMRKYCNTKLKIKLNRPINTLATTQQSVAQMSQQIRNALIEAKELGEAAYAHALMILCDKLVNKMASIGVDALVKAFPYAYLAHNLICFESQLLDLILAKLNESCIYTIPLYLSQKSFSSKINYMKALGYGVSSDNQIDDESKYFSKMFGCVCFFVALMVLPGSQLEFGVSDAWQWIARLLNKKPRSCTSTVLLAFLDIGCYDMQRSYAKQFPKIMRLIQRDFLPLLWEKTDEQKASLSRIRLFLKNYWDKRGQIDPPSGRNLPSSQLSEQGIKQIDPRDYNARE